MREKPESVESWDKYRSGNRVVKAKRLSSGNWMISGLDGTDRRAITHDTFQKLYERLPNDYQGDRQTRPRT